MVRAQRCGPFFVVDRILLMKLFFEWFSTIFDDFYVVDCYQAFLEHCVKVRQKFLNVFLAIDDFDQDGEVGGQINQAGRVNPAVGSVSHASMKYGSAGKVKLFCLENEFAIERFSMPGIRFADIDAKTFGVCLNFRHQLSPLCDYKMIVEESSLFLY